MENQRPPITQTPPSLAALPKAVATITERAAARLASGHPWVYRTDIERVTGGAPDTASVCDVRTSRGRFIGRGVRNPRSVIAVRLFTRNPDEALDDDLVAARAQKALATRRAILDGVDGGKTENSACRLIFAEGDGLPGLIVDKFGPVAVFQSLAFAAEVCRDAVLRAIEADPGLGIEHIVERNDAPVRLLEGLAEAKGPWPPTSHPPPDPVEVREGAMRFLVSPLSGQKTGHYLDQRDNRAMVAALAADLALRTAAEGRGLDVLDCFSYTGGFAVAACRGAAGRGGIGRLVCVDSSEPALRLAAENLSLNGGPSDPEIVCANAFDYLRSRSQEAGLGGGFDLIILDPPPFAREKRMIPGAVRGYKEINLRAIKLLRPGGFLVTCACSHHIGRDLFQDVLVAAAADARRRMRLVTATGQPPDHPVLLGHPEGEYLRCIVLQDAAGLP
jgi:23S rRNA (cytosine1962-C5)-methyltransferase